MTSEGYKSPLAKIVNGIGDWDSFIKELNEEYKRFFLGASGVQLYASLYVNEKEDAANEVAKIRPNLL